MSGGAGRQIKSVFVGSVGNLVEWYDWYAYSALTLYFAPVFFPNASPTAQLLNAAGVFAVGFFMRPIGGWLLGLYADRHGRKAALTFSVTLMCAGSLLIAVTPGYATIGVAAPAILLFARLIQGISVGGEYGASATYLSEIAHADRRGFYTSFQYVTLIGGQLLALTILVILQRFLLTPEELKSWGWRIPFFIGALCAVVAWYLRRSLPETDSFVATTKNRRMSSSVAALLGHPRQVLTVIGLTMGGTVAFYCYSNYMQKFLVNTAGFTKDDATLISTASLVVFMAVQPIAGALSDRVGRRAMLLTFGILGTLTTVPIMTTLSTTHDAMSALMLVIAGLLINSCYSAISGVVKAEMFPTEIRAIGVALPYSVAVSLFGGTAEYIALWLKDAGHEPWFYWYVTGCIVCSLGVYAIMPDTKRFSRIDTDQV